MTPTGDARPPSRWQTAVAETAQRIHRLDPRLMLPVPRVLLVLLWIAAAVTAWLLALPGVVEPILLATPGLHNEFDFVAPMWFRIVFFLVGAAVAASAAVVASLRSASLRTARRRVLPTLAVAVTAGMPVLLMAADWNQYGVVVGLPLAITAVVAQLVRSRHPAGTLRLAIVAAATGGTWVVTAWAETQLRDGGWHWAWNGTSVSAIVFAVFAGSYAVSETVSRRTADVRPRLGRRMSRRVLALVIAAAAVVCALRLTIATDWFGEYDARLWHLPGPVTWPHALLVGVLIIVLAVRSDARPRTPRGRAAATALLVAGSLAVFVAWVPTYLVAVLVAVGGGEPSLHQVVRSKNPLEAVILLGFAVFLLPRFKHSAGRVMAIVALAHVGVRLLDRSLDELGVVHERFWAEAVQVVLVLVAGSAVLFVTGLIARRELIPRRTLLLLAAVPVIAVHGALLLPAVLSTALGTAVVIAAAVAAIVFAMPEVPADRVRHSWQTLAATALDVLALASVVLAIGHFAPYGGDAFQDTAVTWIALPLTAALCHRRRRLDVPEARSPADPVASGRAAIPSRP